MASPAKLNSRLESAKREAEAHLEIMNALAKLRDDESAERVIRVVSLLLEADRIIPGVLSLVARRKGKEC